MQWTFEDAPDHLLITVEGDFLLQPVLRLLDEIRQECRSRGYDRVLVDCRTMGGLVSEGDKFVFGSRLAERLGAVRVAAVFSPGVTITGFAMRVAARRGGKFFGTTEMNDALRYLDGEGS